MSFLGTALNFTFNLGIMIPYALENELTTSVLRVDDLDVPPYHESHLYHVGLVPYLPANNVTVNQSRSAGNILDISVALFYYQSLQEHRLTSFLFPKSGSFSKVTSWLTSELDTFSLYWGKEWDTEQTTTPTSINYAVNRQQSLVNFWIALFREYDWQSGVVMLDQSSPNFDSIWLPLSMAVRQAKYRAMEHLHIHLLYFISTNSSSMALSIRNAVRLGRVIHIFAEETATRNIVEHVSMLRLANSQVILLAYNIIASHDQWSLYSQLPSLSEKDANQTDALMRTLTSQVVVVTFPKCLVKRQNTSRLEEALWDGVHLFSVMLNETFPGGQNSSSDSQTAAGTAALFADQFRNRTFVGLDGGQEAYFDERSVRLTDVVMSFFGQETANFRPVLVYHQAEDTLVLLSDDWTTSQMQWWPPSSSLSLCLTSRNPLCQDDPKIGPEQIVGIIFGLTLPVLASMILWRFVRQYMEEAAVMSSWWQVPAKSILFPDHTSSLLNNRDDSVLNAGVSILARSRTQLVFSGNAPRFVTLNKRPAWRSLVFGEAVGPLRISRALRLFIQDLKTVQHPNVNAFLGISLDCKPPSILEYFCSRGSIADWIEEGTHYSWDLRFSLLLDLLQGLQYIHASPVKFHGNLKSTKCLLDQSFGLKISDVGNERIICLLRHGNLTDIQSIVNRFDRRLTVPKIFEEDTMSPGGDIFSFGLVACEIVTEVDSAQLLNENLMNGQQSKKSFHNPLSVSFNPIRFGSVCVDGHDFLDLRLLSLIQRCCDENPYNRPSVNRCIEVVTNLMDVEMGTTHRERLVRRLASYAQTLETAVAEKTTMVIRERDKCERLLQELVPKEIVRHFFCGESVAPDSFEMATVLCTELYGFLDFVESSRPVVVFGFLHQLYSLVDEILQEFDVYKVDVIGDQYTVVSGAPTRIEELHAGEICQLAIDLQLSFAQLKERRKMQLSVGIHTDPVTAGVVGVRRPRYCLFGGLVDVARRLAHEGATGSGILVSAQTQAFAKPLGFHFVRNKGATVRIRV